MSIEKRILGRRMEHSPLPRAIHSRSRLLCGNLKLFLRLPHGSGFGWFIRIRKMQGELHN